MEISLRASEPKILILGGTTEAAALATAFAELPVKAITSLAGRTSNPAKLTGTVRSGGFDRALQHDTVLRPEDCGGPVVDLSGRVVAINIARAGRVESYALPTAAVRPILSKLMSAESRTAKK